MTTNVATVPRTHVRRSGLVRVAAPVETAFPLFTPLGEKLWAPGWDPAFHHPADGTPVAGMAFSTANSDGAPTHWVLVDWDPERHVVRYARMTPGLRVGTVEVTCRTAGPAATAAQITYDLTAISDVGDADLATWTKEWFAGFLQEWEGEIARALGK
jgi:hypothetical protein